jgi:hypothetical protein
MGLIGLYKFGIKDQNLLEMSLPDFTLNIDQASIDAAGASSD